MNFRVWFRPNINYLGLIALLIGAPALVAVTSGGFVLVLTVAFGAVGVFALLVPVVSSTILRVPVLVIDDEGVRLPLMGVRLAWAGVARVRQVPGPHRNVLLIVPNDPQAALQQARPWLRADGRASMARYGTPIVVRPASVDRTLDEIEAAVARFRPAFQDGGMR